MTGNTEAVTEALWRIDAQVAQAAQNAERMQTLAARIQGITVAVTSPGRELTVHVDANGRLTDVTFTPDALELEPARLSTIVLDALAEGYRRTKAESLAIAEETLGPQSTTVAKLREDADRYAPKLERDDGGIIR